MVVKLKNNWVLQQDDDPKHQSRFTSEQLRRNNMKVLECPSPSPDLNPIEMICRTLNRLIMLENLQSV
ncbi:hypothetical protein LDENG_00028700 [Lucifuga dentata]|nr:hypothetical protein LDENG_00028700 [Lucifuga dentata]